MENKKLIVLFAAAFSILFSIIYYFLFSMTIQNAAKDSRTLYMNQVGLYEKKDSITSMQDTLKKAGLQAYTLKQKDLTAVVCSVNTNESETKKEQAKLKELKYSYIQKSVRVEDQEVVKLIDQKEYARALERIGK